jgi:hypothetical protein
MAKSIKSIYFYSDLLIKAEEQDLNLNALCNEALRIAVNKKENQGEVEGALGNYLTHQTERINDMKILRRLSKKRNERFNRALHAFAEKYNMELYEVIKELHL